MAEVKIKSYGKINLSLDVCGTREDGYHELQTVMQKISLHDDVSVKWTPNQTDQIDINLKCNKAYLPTDSRNLAYKAAEVMVQRFGKQVGGGIIDIYIDKHLPVAAGLAGGSGNGAALLIALNRLWGLDQNTKSLCAIGEELGADVPFCVLIQNTKFDCALCEGTGAEMTPIRNNMKTTVLLVKPAFGVSTKEVYKGIDSCVISARPNTDELVRALKFGKRRKACANMVNVLEEYTLNKYIDVKNLKDEIERETSAEKVLMTGSGPTVFGIFGRVKDAKEACALMRSKGYEAYWAMTL